MILLELMEMSCTPSDVKSSSWVSGLHPFVAVVLCSGCVAVM